MEITKIPTQKSSPTPMFAQGSLSTATKALSPTATETTSIFWEEDFNNDINNWKIFVTHGDLTQLDLHISKSQLIY